MAKQSRKCTRSSPPTPPVYELAAFTVFGFCLSHGLSRRKLYYMLETGEGPRVMKCGTRTLISVEAARAWRRSRERATAALRPAGGHRGKNPRLVQVGGRRRSCAQRS